MDPELREHTNGGYPRDKSYFHKAVKCDTTIEKRLQGNWYKQQCNLRTQNYSTERQQRNCDDSTAR